MVDCDSWTDCMNDYLEEYGTNEEQQIICEDDITYHRLTQEIEVKWCNDCKKRIENRTKNNNLYKAKLRIRILALLREKGCLNTMEICRSLNGFPYNNYQVCYENARFGINRTWMNPCQGNRNSCKIRYRDVYRGGSGGLLDILRKKHLVQTRKMRFWDKGKALPTDTFRFWFIHYHDFEQRVLKQTLIPYV